MKGAGKYERQNLLLIVCPYCEKKILNREEVQEEITSNPEKQYTLRTSHGICPDCLYHNFPQAYLTIQEESKVRIKSTYKKGYSALKEKISHKWKE